MTKEDIQEAINEYVSIEKDLKSTINKIEKTKHISDTPVKNSISGILNLVDKKIEKLQDRLKEK